MQFTDQLLPAEVEEHQRILDILSDEELKRRDILMDAISDDGIVTYQIFTSENRRDGTVSFNVNDNDVYFGGGRVIDENGIPKLRVDGTFGIYMRLMSLDDKVIDIID